MTIYHIVWMLEMTYKTKRELLEAYVICGSQMELHAFEIAIERSNIGIV